MAPPLHEHVVRSKHARQTEASCIAAASVHEGRLTVVKDAPRAALRIRVHRAPPGTKPRPPCGALADCPDGSGLVLSTWLSVLCSRSPNCRKLVTVIYSPTAESRHISMQKADQAKRYVAEGVRMGAGFCPESAGLTWRRGAVEAIVASGGRLLVRGYAASPDSDVADALAGPVEGGHASDPPPKDPLAFRCVYDSGCAHVAMSRRACFMIDEVAGRVYGWGQEFRTRALPGVFVCIRG